MKNLLLEFLKNILLEKQIKAVKVDPEGERIVYFKSIGSAQNAYDRGTHRPFVQGEDENIPDGAEKSTPAKGKTPTPAGQKGVPTTKPRAQPQKATSTKVNRPFDAAKDRAIKDQKTEKLFGYVDRPTGRVIRRMSMYAFESTINDRLSGDKKQQGKKLLSGIEELLDAHSRGDKRTVNRLVKELNSEFKFYSNASGTSFKTQAFGMGERHFLGKTALARDLVGIFESAGINVRAAEDQDRGFKKQLDASSKPKLGEKEEIHTYTQSPMTRRILGKFTQIADKHKQLYGPTDQKTGDLLDNTGGKSSREYLKHSVENNKSLSVTAELLRKSGFDKMANSMEAHAKRMEDIVTNWDKYTPEEREKAVAQSYADMAVQLHSTKFGGDSEMCSAIMKNLAEINLYDQELAAGKEVYLPASGNFPAADKIVRIKGGNKAERIDSISVKFGKNGKVYGMPAQSSTIGLLHPDSFYHNLTGGRVGVSGYETGIRSDALDKKTWKRMMEESGYSKYITNKQQESLRLQFLQLQDVISKERGKIKPKVTTKTLVLMMKNNPAIKRERQRLQLFVNQLDLNKLSEHTGDESTALMRRNPLSFASLLAAHASIITAKGYPDLLHCHQEITDADNDGSAERLEIGIDSGDSILRNWHPLFRDADERGGGLLLGFNRDK